MFAEANDIGDAGESIDLPPLLEILEPGEEIAREKRLGRPERPTSPHPSEANTRGEDFEREITLKKKRDFILLFGGGVDAIPVQFMSDEWSEVVAHQFLFLYRFLFLCNPQSDSGSPRT